MQIRRCALALASGITIVLAATSQVRVHPHVFAEATLEVSVGPENTVQSLGHVWRFDDLFSSTVLLEFDEDSDLVLNDAELRNVADTVHGSLAEFDYFQVVSADGRDVKMKAPEQLIAAYENDQLTILFQSEPEKPLELSGTVSFGVYDPTFYTAIDFTEDQAMMVDGLPKGCSRAVVRPDPDEAIAQNQDTLTEAFFNDPESNNYGKLFATRLELTCNDAS